jgi:hypothetical protein
MKIAVKTRCRTLYHHSEIVTVVKPRRPTVERAPSEDWVLVQFDDGGRSWMHHTMLAVINEEA